MKKIITLLLFIFFYQTSFSQTWIQRDSFPGQGRSRAASFSIGDTCYVVAGGSNSGNYLKTAYAYDTLTNTWWPIASYPGSGSDGVQGFAINGKGYVGIGAVGGYQYFNDFWEYNPGSNTWTQIPSFPGQPRSFAVSFVLNGKGYVGGGDNGYNNNPLPDFWAYDPVANQWDSVATCPASGVGQQACGFSIGNKGYVGTGINLNVSNTDAVQDFWEYDPTIGHLGTWIQEDSFPGAPRALAVGFGFCDKGYLGCGNSYATGNPYYNDFWGFDPNNGPKGKWTQVANFGGRIRCALSVFVVGRSAFAGLGADYSNSYPDSNPLDFYEYTPLYIPAFTTANSTTSTVCVGGSISYMDTSNYSPDHWYWQFPGGTPSTDTTPNPTVEYDTVGTYNVIFSAWNSCDSGTQTFTGYVAVNPAGALTILPPYDTICNGQSVSLVIKNDLGANFSWTPSLGLNGTTGDSVVATPTMTTIYSVTGISTGGCGFNGIDTITVNPAPSFVILPLDTAFCNGQQAILYVSGGGANFIWTPSTEISDSTLSITQDSIMANPTVTTTYTVIGDNPDGCASSGTDVITVIPSPNKPTFTQNGNVLTSSSQYDNQWYRNDTLLVNDTSQNLTITTSGEYWVEVTNEANGCSTSSDPQNITTGINLLKDISDQLSIYPNPFNNSIVIRINSSAENVKEEWSLQVRDVLGRTIYTRSSLDYNDEIDLSGFANGAYFITVINQTGRAVVPVVKQN